MKKCIKICCILVVVIVVLICEIFLSLKCIILYMENNETNISETEEGNGYAFLPINKKRLNLNLFLMKKDLEVINETIESFKYKYDNETLTKTDFTEYSVIQIYIFILYYISFINYFIGQIILLIKYKNHKTWLKVNIFIILILLLIHSFKTYLFFYKLLTIILLIIGIMVVYILRKRFNCKIINFLICILFALELIICIFNIGPKVYYIEQSWFMSEKGLTKDYSFKISNNKFLDYCDIKILDIDKEGVTIEYTLEYYKSTAEGLDIKNVFDESNYKFVKETVQEKLLWNVLYKDEHTEHHSPVKMVDSGTYSYIMFKK